MEKEIRVYKVCALVKEKLVSLIMENTELQVIYEIGKTATPFPDTFLFCFDSYEAAKNFITIKDERHHEVILECIGRPAISEMQYSWDHARLYGEDLFPSNPETARNCFDYYQEHRMSHYVRGTILMETVTPLRVIVNNQDEIYSYYAINRPPYPENIPTGCIFAQVLEFPQKVEWSERVHWGIIDYQPALDFETVWKYDLLPVDPKKREEYSEWREENEK